MLSRSNLIKILINSLIGAVLIFVWFKLVNLAEIGQVIEQVRGEYLILFFVFFVVSTILRSYRLKILLKEYRLGLVDLTKLTFISQFLSFFIPIRAGEIAKSVYLHTQRDIPLAKIIIWILLDRFLDFWSVLLLLCLIFPLVQVNLPTSVFLIILFGFTSSTLIAAGILISPIRTQKLLAPVEYSLIHSKLKNFYRETLSKIIEGFLIFRKNIFDLPKLILLSVLALISDAAIWLIIFYALGLNISSLTTLFGSLISMLTFLIPSAPGYVGSAEGSGLLVFGAILGLDRNLASAAVLINHILTILALPAFGIACLYWLKFDLKLVWRKLRGK